MRREHHPYWVEKLMEKWNGVVSSRLLHPHFDALGAEPRFTGPGYVEVRGPNIRAGDHFHVYATQQQRVSFAVDPFDGGMGEIVIGNYCIFAPGVRVRSALSIHIGNSCMLAENAYITDADWHDPYHRIFPGKRDPVVIEDNVWVGDGVTICKGVTIGENSIIGAASVVTRSIPRNTIAAGNPARPISELDPTLPSTRRDALFVNGLPYQDFKNDFDRKRLAGNTLLGWARAKVLPGKKT